VHSNIAEALGEGFMTALIMLDLSAVFDNPVLLKHFKIFLGMKMIDILCTWYAKWAVLRHQGKCLILG